MEQVITTSSALTSSHFLPVTAPHFISPVSSLEAILSERNTWFCLLYCVLCSRLWYLFARVIHREWVVHSHSNNGLHVCMYMRVLCSALEACGQFTTPVWISSMGNGSSCILSHFFWRTKYEYENLLIYLCIFITFMFLLLCKLGNSVK